MISRRQPPPSRHRLIPTRRDSTIELSGNSTLLLFTRRLDPRQGRSFNTRTAFPESRRMRLATLNTPRGPRPAALVGDRFVDLVSANPSLPPSVRRLIAEPALLAAARAAAARPGAP